MRTFLGGISMESRKYSTYELIIYRFIWHAILFVAGGLMGLDIAGIFFPAQILARNIGIILGGIAVNIILEVLIRFGGV